MKTKLNHYILSSLQTEIGRISISFSREGVKFILKKGKKRYILLQSYEDLIKRFISLINEVRENENDK